MKLGVITTTVVLLALMAPAAGKPNPVKSNAVPVAAVIVSEPSDLGPEKQHEKNAWMKALLAEAARFRFGALFPLLQENSGASKFTPYTVTQTFDIDYKNKTVTYAAGLSSPRGAHKKLKTGGSYSFDSFGAGVDSCFLFLSKQLTGTMPPEAMRFFDAPAFSGNYAVNKKYGALLDRQMRTDWVDGDFTRSFEKLLKKDSVMLMLLSSYAASAIREKSGDAGIAPDRQRHLSRAALLYECILSCPAAPYQPETGYRTGLVYEWLGRYFAAAVRYEANTRLFPQDQRNFEHLASLLISKKEWLRAKGVLETAMQLPRPSAPIRKMMAQTCAALGDEKRAVSLYQSYLAQVPNDAVASGELGAILFSEKAYDQAVEPLRRASGLQNAGFNSWFMLGFSCVNSGDLQGGRDALIRALALNRSHLPTIELLARCHRSLKQDDELSGVLATWASLEPRRPDIRLELGLLHFSGNRMNEAISALTEASSLLPIDPRPHKLLARCYEKTGDDKMLFSHLKTANRFAPDEWDTWNELGRYYIGKGFPVEAAMCLQKTIALNPACHAAQYELGALLLDNNDAPAGYALLAKVIDAEPNNPRYLSQFARAESIVGSSRKACQLLGDALRIAPEDPGVLFISGLTYKNCKAVAEAEQTLKKALALDKSMTECHVALGDLYYGQYRFTAAAASYLTAWTKKGYQEEIAFKLGRTLFETGKYAEAKNFFEAIVTRAPGRDDARYWLVATLCKLDKADLAGTVAKEFTGSSVAWTQLGRGLVHETSSNSAGAAVSYAVAIRVAPENPLALQGTARLFLAKKVYDSALFYYAAARQKNPRDLGLAMAVADVHEQRGGTDSALALLYTIDEACPEFNGVQARIARVRSIRNEHAAAIAILKRGIRFHPDDSKLYAMLGKEYALTKEYESAVDAYQMAVKYGRESELDALLQIGNIYYENLMNSRKARSYYARYVKAGGKDGLALSMAREKE